MTGIEQVLTESKRHSAKRCRSLRRKNGGAYALKHYGINVQEINTSTSG
jgi:hypothetical protein